jgi:hypothetical protein
MQSPARNRQSRAASPRRQRPWQSAAYRSKISGEHANFTYVRCSHSALSSIFKYRLLVLLGFPWFSGTPGLGVPDFILLHD